MAKKRRRRELPAGDRRSRHRRHFHRARPTTPGSAPGVLRVDPAAPQPVIHVITYGPEHFEEHGATELDRLPELHGRHDVTWIDVAGLGDGDVLHRLGELFDIHPLALEDVVNVSQRAKTEPYGDTAFLVLHMPLAAGGKLTEQVSLVVRQGLVVTFQERVGDCFEPVRERLRTSRARLRSGGADYLAYALVDAVIDAYFPVLESIGERLEVLEESLFAAPSERDLEEIHHLRRELIALRKALAPHREALASLLRESIAPFRESTLLFVRDVYDHALRVLELLETYRELCASLMDLYMSGISQRTNEVMKVLTMIATIFIPLSFLVGLYGMNFDTSQPGNMPELDEPYAYVVMLGVMATVAGGLLVYFRRKGWL